MSFSISAVCSVPCSSYSVVVVVVPEFIVVRLCAGVWLKGLWLMSWTSAAGNETNACLRWIHVSYSLLMHHHSLTAAVVHARERMLTDVAVEAIFTWESTFSPFHAKTSKSSDCGLWLVDSVWPWIIFGSFELNFKAFHADLEAVHGLNGCLRWGRVVEADEAEALALVRRPIDEHFGTDHVTKWQEHLHQLGIPELLRQMVDEEVATIRSLPLSQLVAVQPPLAAPSLFLCHGRSDSEETANTHKISIDSRFQPPSNHLMATETTKWWGLIVSKYLQWLVASGDGEWESENSMPVMPEHEQNADLRMPSRLIIQTRRREKWCEIDVNLLLLLPNKCALTHGW